MKQELRSFQPDAIFGVERSGPFIADAAAHGDAALMGKTVRIKKHDTYAEIVASLTDQIEAMIRDGKKKFAFTDVYFSGSTFDKLNKDVLEPLAKRHRDCEFRGFWLRERIGFERLKPQRVPIELGLPDVRQPSDAIPNLVNRPIAVPFAVGDDAAILIEGRAVESVYVYDRDGVITRMF